MEFLENLKQERPKILGFDYYHLIYTVCFFLALMMALVYRIEEDEKIRKMVLTQGIFSFGLVGALMFYTYARGNEKIKIAQAEKAVAEAEAEKKTQSKKKK